MHHTKKVLVAAATGGFLHGCGGGTQSPTIATSTEPSQPDKVAESVKAAQQVVEDLEKSVPKVVEDVVEEIEESLKAASSKEVSKEASKAPAPLADASEIVEQSEEEKLLAALENAPKAKALVLSVAGLVNKITGFFVAKSPVQFWKLVKGPESKTQAFVDRWTTGTPMQQLRNKFFIILAYTCLVMLFPLLEHRVRNHGLGLPIPGLGGKAIMRREDGSACSSSGFDGHSCGSSDEQGPGYFFAAWVRKETDSDPKKEYEEKKYFIRTLNTRPAENQSKSNTEKVVDIAGESCWAAEWESHKKKVRMPQITEPNKDFFQALGADNKDQAVLDAGSWESGSTDAFPEEDLLCVPQYCMESSENYLGGNDKKSRHAARKAVPGGAYDYDGGCLAHKQHVVLVHVINVVVKTILFSVAPLIFWGMNINNLAILGQLSSEQRMCAFVLPAIFAVVAGVMTIGVELYSGSLFNVPSTHTSEETDKTFGQSGGWNYFLTSSWTGSWSVLKGNNDIWASFFSAPWEDQSQKYLFFNTVLVNTGHSWSLFDFGRRQIERSPAFTKVNSAVWLATFCINLLMLPDVFTAVASKMGPKK